jgi:hypothetical protein
MSSTSNGFGLRPVFHPSGIIRQTSLGSGIASGYSTALYSGTPVKLTTTGTLVAVGTGADVAIGVFQGCEFSSAGKYFVLPYWPASQTYDTPAGNNVVNPMWAFFTSDPNIIYEGQANGSVALTANGEGINLADASAGSTYTGQSSQQLNATTTGTTAATFQVVGVAEYPDNTWGDSYTIVRVKISSYQGQVA